MKKLRRIFIILVTLIFITIPNTYATNENTRVIDYEKILTQNEINLLEERINNIKESYNFDFAIVVTKSLEGEDPKNYADDYYDSKRFGVGKDRDGALFLLSLEERSYYISTHGSGIDIINEDEIKLIGEEIVPMLKSENYYEAFESVINSVDSVIENSIFIDNNVSKEVENNSSEGGVFVWILLVPILIFLLIAIFTKNRTSSSRSSFHDNIHNRNAYPNDHTHHNYHDSTSYTDSHNNCGSDHGGGGGDY